MSTVPTPMSFDTFVPWMAIQLQLPVLIEINRIQEEVHQVMHGKSKRFSRELDASIRETSYDTKGSSALSPSNVIKNLLQQFVVPLKTYYDKSNKLLQVEILPTHFAIPCKIINIIDFCFPYHTHLHKLIFRNAKITDDVIFEIGKVLNHAELTEICLDDTYVAHAYSVLLDNPKSCLKHLSLCRCHIDSSVCQDIASKLVFGCPAEKTLRVLDITSNNIGDIGAICLGVALRSNRCLLHLNISDNQISDEGFGFILDNLTAFPLTCDEIMLRKERYMLWLKERQEIYRVILSEVKGKRIVAEVEKIVNKSRRRSSMAQRRKSGASRTNVRAQLDLAANEVAEAICKEKMPKEIDPFSREQTINKHGYAYCTGNVILCSLNVAYNDLEFGSLKKLIAILKYQSNNIKGESTGLLRVVLDGNRIPMECDELIEINALLQENSQPKVAKKKTVVPKAQLVNIKHKPGTINV